MSVLTTSDSDGPLGPVSSWAPFQRCWSHQWTPDA